MYMLYSLIRGFTCRGLIEAAASVPPSMVDRSGSAALLAAASLKPDLLALEREYARRGSAALLAAASLKPAAGLTVKASRAWRSAALLAAASLKRMFSH